MLVERARNDNAMLIRHRSIVTKRNVCGLLTFLLLFSSLAWISTQQMAYSNGAVQTEGFGEVAGDAEIKQLDVPSNTSLEFTSQSSSPHEETFRQAKLRQQETKQAALDNPPPSEEIIPNIGDILNATLGVIFPF